MTSNLDDSEIRVLLAEDNFYSAMALQTFFNQQQINVDIASDGIDAAKMVKQRLERYGRTYQLIILDLNMPHCDGFDSAQ